MLKLLRGVLLALLVPPALVFLMVAFLLVVATQAVMIIGKPLR